MAVPKKKSARSRSTTRYNTYVRVRRKKLLNFVERAKRNERGLEKIEARTVKAKKKTKKITKIVA
ncbi:hypothetical protein HZA38_01690 [Candidatus Peregrinibacteria bacterium]|nr:hypothetical protein [Candidatus Peregrinibacteria bacterium]